jgi:hypothetical protein
MKIWLLPLLMAFASLTSCVVDEPYVVRDRDDDDNEHVRAVTYRRYSTYTDADPYYTVYPRSSYRPYYRQAYYANAPVYSRRYYTVPATTDYSMPARTAYVRYGY